MKLFIKSFLGLLLFLFHVEQVWAQSFVVLPEQVRAFAENEIQVSISDWNCEAMQVRTDNGKIKKLGPCKYVLIPQRLGSVNITVSKVQGASVVDVGIKTIKADGRSLAARSENEYAYSSGKKQKAMVEAAPDFSVVFNGRTSGVLRRRFDFRKKELQLMSANNNALAQAEIVSFKVLIIKEDILEYEQQVNGNSLDQQALLSIIKQKENRTLLLSGIRVKYKGKLLLVNDLEFTIHN